MDTSYSEDKEVYSNQCYYYHPMSIVLDDGSVLFVETILEGITLLLYAGCHFYLLMPPNLIFSSVPAKCGLSEQIWTTALMV